MRCPADPTGRNPAATGAGDKVKLVHVGGTGKSKNHSCSMPSVSWRLTSSIGHDARIVINFCAYGLTANAALQAHLLNQPRRTRTNGVKTYRTRNQAKPDVFDYIEPFCSAALDPRLSQPG